jgi:hypothetical protein
MLRQIAPFQDRDAERQGELIPCLGEGMEGGILEGALQTYRFFQARINEVGKDKTCTKPQHQRDSSERKECGPYVVTSEADQGLQIVCEKWDQLPVEIRKSIVSIVKRYPSHDREEDRRLD